MASLLSTEHSTGFSVKLCAVDRLLILNEVSNETVCSKNLKLSWQQSILLYFEVLQIIYFKEIHLQQ